MVKTAVMLEEGAKALRRWAAKHGTCSESQVLLYSAMGSCPGDQDVTVLVDGAQIPGRWAAGLLVCSEWETVVCFQ